ncbi:general vesicular transport factor p115 [Trichonephila inaurata madagascariensis]|uniref:General vesicular transport factor p115 n=1 Tax=Trichonephila inaurata madagascariensis TaxID=2747483 RepID=A0A8X7CH74_9ARAC|nr:general vesicular transport factor p115 [Trichonephila inaurata madagascariensis]
MEYFKSGLKSVLGAPQDAQQPTAAETVEKLVERVQTSTLLDDRRDACRALKALSNKFRLEIGAQAMDALIRVLECDRSDNEILGYALEAICNVVNGPRDDESPDYVYGSGDDLGLQFTEIFIKKSENVSLLLELIEEYDFKVRWPIVRLLSGLLSHRPKELQECILVSPMGVSRLMDLLSDTREIIRNDTLLLLEHLTKSNANIQKIVAFENGFDKLLSVISDEGYSDGGVIVGDCLRVMLTLLKNNTSNVTFFKEGSYIKHLTPFFDLQDSSERGWTQQKAMNTLIMLQIVRVLASPNNPQQVTVAAQKDMYQCGLLEQLCSILMASGVPADVLAETINTVGELIRGNHSNQEYFSTVCAPTTPPKPAIVVLLMSMVNDKQPFSLRCAVLYCFQCFLYRNELGQAQIVQTLLPSTADVNTITVGQLLCGGLFSMDSVSNWFAAVALSHSLVDNPTQKEQLLRVQLATSVGNPAISLVNQCAIMLQQGGKLQTRLGLLMLMSTWLAHCTIAVMQFLSIPTNIPFLTSQVNLAEGDENEDLVQGICAFLLGICIEFNDNSQPSFTKDDLCQLIVKRIGLETFLDKLVAVTKNENYSRAAQNPHLKFKQPSEVLFDFEFCRLFKSLEGTVIKAVQPKPKLLNGPESSMTPEQQELLRQYKDLIREQDQQLHELKSEITELKSQYELSKTQVDDMTSTIQQLKDQNALLKAQRSVSGSNSSQEVLQLKQEIEQLKNQCNQQQLEINAKNEEVIPKEVASLSTETDERTSEHDEEAIKKISNLESQLEISHKEISSLKEELKEAQEKLQKLSVSETDSSALQETNVQLTEECDSLKEQLATVRKEQEDILILLTEQSDQIAVYKKRLRNLGETVEDDDDSINDESDDLGNDINDLKDDIPDE